MSKIVHFSECPFTWTQTDQVVELFVPLPQHTRGRDLKEPNGVCSIQQLFLFAKEHKAATPLIDIKLVNSIDAQEGVSTWEIRDGFICFSLHKQRTLPWPCILDKPLTADLIKKYNITASFEPVREEPNQDFDQEIVSWQSKFANLKSQFLQKHQQDHPAPSAIERENVELADKKYMEATTEYEKVNFKEALRIYEESANLGNLQAQTILASFYSEQESKEINDIDPDPKKSFYYLQLAAFQHEDLPSIRQIAAMYDVGSNKDVAVQSYEQALIFISVLAMHGDVRSMEVMGTYYMKGLGVVVDYTKALMWFQVAFIRGASWAAYNLGVIYRDGSGVPVDMPKALRYFKLAAFWAASETLAKVASTVEATIKAQTQHSIEASSSTTTGAANMVIKSPQSLNMSNSTNMGNLDYDMDEEEVLSSALDQMRLGTYGDDIPQHEQDEDEMEQELLRQLDAQQQQQFSSNLDANYNSELANILRAGEILSNNNQKSASSSSAVQDSPWSFSSLSSYAQEPTSQQGANKSAQKLPVALSSFSNNSGSTSVFAPQADSSKRQLVVAPESNPTGVIATEENEKSAWWTIGEYALGFGILGGVSLLVHNHFLK